MGEVIRWTVNVAPETDIDVRTYLAQRGMKKGDLSRFIEESVRHSPSSGLLRPSSTDPHSRLSGYTLISFSAVHQPASQPGGFNDRNQTSRNLFISKWGARFWRCQYSSLCKTRIGPQLSSAASACLASCARKRRGFVWAHVGCRGTSR